MKIIGKLKDVATAILRNRFALFVIFLCTFAVVQRYFSGGWLPGTDTEDLWFYSGIFMVLFSILFIEPYYTSPKNVLTNAIPLLLVLLPIQSSFARQEYWWGAIIIIGALIAASVVAMTFESKDVSPLHWQNKLSSKLKGFVVTIGQGRILYSAVFFYFLFTYHSIQDTKTVVLFVLWALILMIDPKIIKNDFNISARSHKDDQIGEIFGVQSKKIFLVKLFEDRKGIYKFDIVKFRYSMQDTDDLSFTGIVFDTYLLNQEKWAKVLQLGNASRDGAKLVKNIVYQISDEAEVEQLADKMNVSRFVGVVVDGSTIGKIKFEYSKKEDDIQDGDLLELKVGERRLFYQVVAGFTQKERLEARNESGFIEGEAVQLGEWNDEKFSFERFGWVPAINTPVFQADTSDIEVPTITYPDFKAGLIPGTSLPSVLMLSEAVGQHMALIGVTGSGKSHLAKKIVGELLADTRVVCIDFTGEWKKLFAPANYDVVTKDLVVTFLDSSDKKPGIFELPDMSNTTGVITETQSFIEKVFVHAKSKFVEGKSIKVALVLEEAHTITPETGFVADNDWGAKALVNKMVQVALQGRKYGVGLLVLAQRTANVSKTVLTQCNTIVAFQAFDETSFTFLGNYVGKDMVQALPNLKEFHAVVAGKGSKANLPMIVNMDERPPNSR